VCKIIPDGLFIFHDVDTYPTYWGSINYEAKPGQFKRPVSNMGPENLGLICSCWKSEFEKTNGFANYWGWGSEDAALHFRAKKLHIPIDESNMIHHTNVKHIINLEHYRNADKQTKDGKKNGELLNLEKKTLDSSNGLTNINYEVLSSFELAPRFTIINVDFTLKSES
jgi:hypothetical protein